MKFANPVSRLVLPLFCFTLLVSNVSAQDGSHEWGYERDSGSQDRFDQAIRLLEQATTVSLEPDSGTDSVLNSVTLSRHGDDFRALNMTGSLNAASQDFFWFVDTSAGTYRTFSMTWNIDADASRLHQFLSQKLPSSSSISLARMKQGVAAAYSMKLDQEADFTDRTATYSYPVCWGGGRARIAAYDPLILKLVETDAWADWAYDGTGAYISRGGGYCWANPAVTFRGRVLSHWFVDTCKGDLHATPYVSRSRTYNKSYNDDFLDPDERTWVLQKTSVYHNFGNASWTAVHTDWGEGSILIFGWLLIGYASC